ncbi:WYL domain-containing protein [Lactiplantibacillus garii]|uniref:WYL domain-containing protein n=2 Tax=Lactiplantibacillus garii TaxID=2306423 RepID=A0A3R8J744_9LACO|nr:WYL domain-containing protein [Lactiplantibacillus garii]
MALITSHILLGSRALTLPELNATLDFLGSGLAPEARAALHQQLTMARGSYVPLSRPQPLLDRLHVVAACIAKNQKIRFSYRSSQANEPNPQIHHAQPVAIFFENHYFYAAMLSEERHGYWLYRIDRIVTILERLKGQKLDYDRRFSLQDHRQQAYLLDSGSLTRIRFIYRYYVQTVLDYFPNAKVLKRNPDGSHVIEAYVKVDGAMLWLLSQGAAVQVLAPVSLVERMKAALSAARDQYD